MLSDPDIEAIAHNYFRDVYAEVVERREPGRCHPIKHLELADPPGIYYTIGCSGEEDVVLVGDGGFFVSRRDGSVEHFGSGDIINAQAELTGVQFPALHAGIRLPDEALTIRHILLSRARQFSLKGAPPGTGERRRLWWHFWR